MLLKIMVEALELTKNSVSKTSIITDALFTPYLFRLSFFFISLTKICFNKLVSKFVYMIKMLDLQYKLVQVEPICDIDKKIFIMQTRQTLMVLASLLTPF